FSNALILHYDGNDWLVSYTTTFQRPAILYGVNGRATNDVWAVGAKVTDKGVLDLRLHWDGQRWEQVVEDDRNMDLSLREGWDVAVVPDAPDAWIAGNFGNQPGILHFDAGG